MGFGIDSGIEGLASFIITWRFSGSRTLSQTAEVRAQKAVAISFFLLAPYIAVDAVLALVPGDQARMSWEGIVLAAISIIWMPVLAQMKLRAGRPVKLPCNYR